jgi:hypothetical protein
MVLPRFLYNVLALPKNHRDDVSGVSRQANADEAA